MGLDVYVGSLTRYYARDWKTVVEQFADAKGLKFSLVRDTDAKDAVTDKTRIRRAVFGWRLVLERALGDRLHERLDWDESDSTPYFTNKPDFDGWHALQLLAAEAVTKRPVPGRLPTGWTVDPHWTASVSESPHDHIIKPQIWLPVDFDDVFVGESLAGPSLPFGSSIRLLEQITELNRQTVNGTETDLAMWLSDGPSEHGPQMARFGLAVFTDLAGKSVSARLPMLLDY